METHIAPEILDAAAEQVQAVQQFLQPFVEQRQLLARTDDEISLLIQNGFIAWHRDAIVGFAAVEIYSRKLAEIQCLAVAPEYQGQGIGRTLVQACVGRARQRGVLELMVITASDGFLQRCGFQYALPEQKRALFIQPQVQSQPE